MTQVATQIDALIAQAALDPVVFMETHCGTDFWGLPESLRDGYARYWCLGVKPGRFLSAVIKADLFGAYGAADHINQSRLPEIVSWFYSHADSACTHSKFDAWCMKGGYLGAMKSKELAEAARNGNDIL